MNSLTFEQLILNHEDISECTAVVGEWNVGDGFWADCVEPLVTGKSAAKQTSNDGRELPVFPTAMTGAGTTCLAKSGKFWKKH